MSLQSFSSLPASSGRAVLDLQCFVLLAGACQSLFLASGGDPVLR